jgi:peptide/nickel transport system substrate-binding protein
VFASGGTAVVAVSSLPTNFNPWSPSGANRVTAEVMEQVWPQTFVTDGGMHATTEPGFVENAEVESIAPFEVVYTLNPKAVWSDGTPIGVDDFIYNWHEQLAWAPELPDGGLLAGYRDISAITSSNGGSTVTVTFSQPFAEWEGLFSDLVPAHIASKYGWVAAFDGFDPAKVISGGPFEITQYVPGQELVLSRNPHYWFTPAHLSRIVLEVQSSADALAGLQDGTVNIAEEPDVPAVTATVADAARAGIALSKATSALPTLWQLCLNLTSPALEEPDLRVGIEQALYVPEIAADSVGLEDAFSASYENRLVLGDSAEGVPAASSPTGSGTGSGSGGSVSGVSGIASNVGDYDPATAISSFQAAGYSLGADGWLRPGGTGDAVTLSMLVPSGDHEIADTAAVIQAQLKAVGILVVIRQMPLAQMLNTALPLGEYQLAIAPFLLTSFAASQLPVYSNSVLPTVPPPGRGDKVAQSIAGSGIEPGAATAGVVTRNIFGLDDPVVSTDITSATANLVPTTSTALITAADTELWADAPSVPLFQQPVTLVHSTDIRAVSDSPTWAGVFWDAESWVIQVSPPVVPSSFPPLTPAG